MKSLMFLIYLSAIGVAIVLEKQSKRQKAETALECARLGLTLPPSRPKVQTLEALLNIAIGIVMLVPAAQGIWTVFSDSRLREIIEPGMEEFYIVLIAAGLTLVILGSAALRQNLIYRKNIAQPGGTAERGSDRAQ